MENEPSGCVFCAIAAGRAPARVIMENAHALCILDIAPFTEGHCLVIPRRHVPWWHEMETREAAGVFDLARLASSRLMEVFKPDFVCMYARGRRIPHTHIFLVPAFSGDVVDRFFHALEGVQESPPRLAALGGPEALERAARKLR